LKSTSRQFVVLALVGISASRRYYERFILGLVNDQVWHDEETENES